MAMLTRGVCRAIPRFFGVGLAEVTTPRAMRPRPPSFSLAKRKTVSPFATRLPPYIVFCALKVNRSARGLRTSALTAKVTGRRPCTPTLRRSRFTRSSLTHEHDFAGDAPFLEQLVRVSRLRQGQSVGDEGLDPLLSQKLEQGVQILPKPSRFQSFERLDAVGNHPFPNAQTTETWMVSAGS